MTKDPVVVRYNRSVARVTAGGGWLAWQSSNPLTRDWSARVRELSGIAPTFEQNAVVREDNKLVMKNS